MQLGSRERLWNCITYGIVQHNQLTDAATNQASDLAYVQDTVRVVTRLHAQGIQVESLTSAVLNIDKTDKLLHFYAIALNNIQACLSKWHGG